MHPNHRTFHFFEQNRTNPAYILIESIHGMFSCHTIAEKVELHFSITVLTLTYISTTISSNA